MTAPPFTVDDLAAATRRASIINDVYTRKHWEGSRRLTDHGNVKMRLDLIEYPGQKRAVAWNVKGRSIEKSGIAGCSVTALEAIAHALTIHRPRPRKEPSQLHLWAHKDDLL